MKKYQFFSGLFALSLVVFCLTIPASALEPPTLTCGAAILLDGDHGDVLFEKNGYDKMYPASITKIMTSLLVLEAVDRGELALDAKVTASASAIAAISEDSSSADIKPGEILTVEELLYCDLLASANEACNILAEQVAGSIADFVVLMNQRAAQLGMENTHFANPNGLPDDQHYTTAYDITIMAREAMKHEVFRTIVSTAKYVVPPTNMSEERTLLTTNALIGGRIQGYVYSRAIGIKTGSTSAAGQCLASAAVDSDGRTFYCVVLNAKNVEENGTMTRYSFKESRDLFEWGFSNFHRVTLLDKTSVIQEVAVSLSDTDYVLAQPSKNVERTMPADYNAEEVKVSINLPESVEAPVKAGQQLGTVTLSYQGEELETVTMIAADDVARSDLQYYMKVVTETLSQWWVKAIAVVVVVLIFVLVVWLGLIRPRQRRRYRYGRRKTYSGRKRYSGSRRRR